MTDWMTDWMTDRMATQEVQAQTTAPETAPEADVLAAWLARAAAAGLTLHLVDPGPPAPGHRARFYQIWLQPTLWGSIDVIRQWGRLGTVRRRPRQLVDCYPDQVAALAGLRPVLHRWSNTA